jgi:hypothetical protein
MILITKMVDNKAILCYHYIVLNNQHFHKLSFYLKETKWLNLKRNL